MAQSKPMTYIGYETEKKTSPPLVKSPDLIRARWWQATINMKCTLNLLGSQSEWEERSTMPPSNCHSAGRETHRVVSRRSRNQRELRKRIFRSSLVSGRRVLSHPTSPEFDPHQSYQSEKKKKKSNRKRKRRRNKCIRFFFVTKNVLGL